MRLLLVVFLRLYGHILGVSVAVVKSTIKRYMLMLNLVKNTETILLLLVSWHMNWDIRCLDCQICTIQMIEMDSLME